MWLLFVCAYKIYKYCISYRYIYREDSHTPPPPGLCVSLSRGRLAYVGHYPGADCHQSSTIPPWPMCVTIHGQTATSHQPFHPGLCVTIQGQTATSHQPFHPGLCVTIQGQRVINHSTHVSLSRGRLPPIINHSTHVCHYPRLPPVINHSTLAYVCHYPGADSLSRGRDCHQSSTIPPSHQPMCHYPGALSTLVYGAETATSHQPFQTATSHQPFHPAYVSLSRGRLPPVINHSTLAYVSLSRGRLSPINHSTLAYVSLSRGRLPPVINHSTLSPVINLCVSLSRCRLPPVINHSTLTYVAYVTIQGQTVTSHQPFHPGLCVTLSTSHQPFHPGLCVTLSRGSLTPVINHSTLTYVCHYPGADCHQSSTIPPCHQPFHPGLCVSLCHQSSTIPPWSMCVTIQGQTATSPTIPPWPMCDTIQGQTATSHQPFHPDLCGSLTIQGQTATSHQPFHPGLCVSLSRARLRLTQQSLKRVGHEGRPFLKGEQRYPPCPSKAPLS